MTGEFFRSFLIGDIVPFSELEKLFLTLSTIYKTSRYILLHFSAQNTRGDEILEVNICHSERSRRATIQHLSIIYKTSRYILLRFSAQNTRGDEILEVNICHSELSL
jgi:hypothetical protein